MTRTPAKRDLTLIFSCILKKHTPRKALLYFFHQKSQHGFFLLKEVKPSPDRKMVKLPTFENLFLPLRHSSETRRKMTTASTFLIHTRTTDLILIVRRSRLRIKRSPFFAVSQVQHQGTTRKFNEIFNLCPQGEDARKFLTRSQVLMWLRVRDQTENVSNSWLWNYPWQAVLAVSCPCSRAASAIQAAQRYPMLTN